MAAMFHSKRARVYFNKPFSRATNSSMPSLKGKHVLLQIAVPNTEVLYFPNTREKKTLETCSSTSLNFIFGDNSDRRMIHILAG
jgi:hypothetical protein